MCQYRKLRDWDQVDLAAAAKMSLGGVRGYEQKKRWPDPEVLERLSAALGTEPANLLGMAPKPTPEEALEVLREAISKPKEAESGLLGEIVVLLRRCDETELLATRERLRLSAEGRPKSKDPISNKG